MARGRAGHGPGRPRRRDGAPARLHLGGRPADHRAADPGDHRAPGRAHAAGRRGDRETTSRPAAPTTPPGPPRPRWWRRSSRTRSGCWPPPRTCAASTGTRTCSLGVPVLLGRGGVEKIVELPLTRRGAHGAGQVRRGGAGGPAACWTPSTRRARTEAGAVTTHEYEAVVVGAGGAGLYAALEASRGARTAVVSKLHPMRSHTGAAQGGIGAALGNLEEDKPEWHAFDTVKGGDYLVDQQAAVILADDAVRAVYDLENRGLPFSRTAGRQDRPAALRRAHPQPRRGARAPLLLRGRPHRPHDPADPLPAVHQERGGLLRRVPGGGRAPGRAAGCAGLVALELATGELHVFRAKALLFATGGFGQMFRTTSNAFANTGDGPALLARRGVPLRGHGVLPVPPHRHPRPGHPDHRGGARRGRHPAQPPGGALHGALRAHAAGPGAPGHDQPGDHGARSWRATGPAATGRIDDYVFLDATHLGKERDRGQAARHRRLLPHLPGAGPGRHADPHPAHGALRHGGHPHGPGRQGAGRRAAARPSRGCTRPGSAPACRCTAPTAWAPTAWWTWWCSAAGRGWHIERYVKGADLAPAGQGPGGPGAGAPGRAHRRQEGPARRGDPGQDARRDDGEGGHLPQGPGHGAGRGRAAGALREEYRAVRAQDRSQGFNTDLLEILELGNLLDLALVTAAVRPGRTESRGAHAREDFPRARRRAVAEAHPGLAGGRRGAAGLQAAWTSPCGSPSRATVLRQERARSRMRITLKIQRFNPETDRGAVLPGVRGGGRAHRPRPGRAHEREELPGRQPRLPQELRPRGVRLRRHAHQRQGAPGLQDPGAGRGPGRRGRW